MTRARLLVASLAVLIAACGGTASTAPTSTGSSRGTSATTTGSTSAGSTGSGTTSSSTASSIAAASTSASSTSGAATATGTSTSGTTGTTGTTSTSTSGTTATSGTSTTGSTSTSGTSGSCPGYALPNDPASCTCGRPGSCSANGCYNGYLCQLSTLRCVSPSACPTSSSTSSTTGSTSTTSTSSTSTSSTGTTGTGSTTGTSGTTGAPPYRVLFDSAHNQVAGSACWVIDSNAPNPQPASPSASTDWNGGISNWGYDLFASGRYTISELPSGTALSYGGGGPGDLTAFDVFVSDEPEADFSSAEQAALVSFLSAGKGVLLVSDHAGAVRCGGCIQAATVINDFLVNGAGTAAGVKTDVNDIATSGLTGNIVQSASLAQVFSNGPFGAGSTFSFHAGTSVSVTNSAVAQVVVDSSAGGMIVASQPTTGGRLVLIGDSSPEENATLGAGTPYTRCSVHNGWGEANDRQIVLNATAWLAHDGS